MANEQLLASRAANRDVADCAPSPFQDCSDVVHLSVFFDGTGNNKDADEASRKWSNVARSWRSAQFLADDRKSIYAIYISGPGTKFNGQATGWLSKGMTWTEDNLTGMGAGGGGDRRLEFGGDNVNRRLRDVLIANAEQMGGELAKYAKESRSKSFEEVNKKLGKHRLIKVINLSVFGFSRGAALGRAFVNRVVAQCERKGNELHYQGYPLRLNFVGLFDTVASFGLPAANVRLPWDERELLVPDEVERCVHYVAAHELRFAFPVDLIRKQGQLKGDWEETLYPGVHSDVGGGYEPVSQGVSNNYARIPMRDMMKEAVAHGVRMLSYGQLSASPSYAALFRERFECLPATEDGYRAYRQACAAGATIEAQRREHMKLLYSAYGTLHRAGVITPGQRQRNEALVKRVLGPLDMAKEVELYRLVKAEEHLRVSDSRNMLAQYVHAKDWQIQAWDTAASDAVANFISQFVHDSKVDFIGNIEPFSYFRLRTLQESTRSVWNETGDWVHDKAEQAQRKAGEIADAAKHKADQAKQAAVSTYETGKRKAGELADAAADKANQAADWTKRKGQQAADWTSEKARQASDAASDAYGAAKRKANEAATEASDAVERVYEEGANWVRRITQGDPR